MANIYNKYLKYKLKYLNLKNQIGGNPQNILLKSTKKEQNITIEQLLSLYEKFINLTDDNIIKQNKDTCNIKKSNYDNNTNTFIELDLLIGTDSFYNIIIQNNDWIRNDLTKFAQESEIIIYISYIIFDKVIRLLQ